MWLVGSKPIRSNVTIPTTSFSHVFFFVQITSCRFIPSLSILNIWRRWGLTALLCLNRMPAYRLIASPQTSFEVRSSRIHLSPTDGGEKWMRDDRTPKDVWGETNRLMTCVFCVSLSSAPLNKTIIVFASFFLAPAPGGHVVGSVKKNVGRKNSGRVGGGGRGCERQGKILLSPSSFLPLGPTKVWKATSFFHWPQISLKFKISIKRANCYILHL